MQAYNADPFVGRQQAIIQDANINIKNGVDKTKISDLRTSLDDIFMLKLFHYKLFFLDLTS